MGRRGRSLLVGALALCGILLVSLGVGGLRELLVIGKVPSEMLGGQVGYTVGRLAVGGALIIWCVAAGIRWAMSPFK